MKPSPAPDPAARFDPCLALADEGRFADAVARALELAAGGDDARTSAAAQTLLRVARAAESGGDAASVDRALGEARRLRPAYADLHFHHGALLARHGRRAEARRALEAALEQHPQYLAARVELAMLDAREGRIGEALSALRDLQKDAEIAEPRAFQQGLSSLERADWEAADALMRRAVRGGDPKLELALERYRALMAKGDAALAADAMRAALEGRESYPDLHALLGAAETAQGHYDDAVSSLARALELNPDYHAARVQLALALDALGDRVSAAEQLHLVLTAEPGHAQAQELLGHWTPRGERREPSHIRRASESSRRKGS